MDYFQRIKVKDALAAQGESSNATLLGWVRTKRISKNVAFLEVNDGSTLVNLQLVLTPAEFPQLEEIQVGAAVKAVGDLVHSQGGKQQWELLVKELWMIGPCGDDYPIQKKQHSLEYLREIAHLRPRTNTFGVINRFRSKMAYGVHRYFQQKGFTYVHTPLITTNDGEGAGEMFTITTLDLNRCGIPEMKGEADSKRISDQTKAMFQEDFFGAHTYVAVTGQLEAEAMATSLGDVYTFGPCFRAENSNTYRHLAEFWMVEPEMAFCELSENMQVMEDFIKYLCRYALEECQEEMLFFHQWVDDTRLETVKALADSTIGVVTYTDAISILQKAEWEFAYPVEWGMDLKSEHERYLTEEHFKQPMMVTDYPKEIKPFYARMNEDGKTVAAVDLLVPQIGEIIGGSQREERYERLSERIAELGMEDDVLEWYLELRRWGSVPHSGFGLGFERMLMYFSGVKNIRDVIAFPRTPNNARF